jgi:hypothetical protein
MKKKKRHASSLCHVRLHRRTLPKPSAQQTSPMTDGSAAEARAWPSLGQLRDQLQCRVRSQPECPYRFDEAL